MNDFTQLATAILPIAFAAVMLVVGQLYIENRSTTFSLRLAAHANNPIIGQGSLISFHKALSREEQRSVPLVALGQRHFLADSIIYMCVFDFRQAQLVKLIDAGNYITRVPKAVHTAPEWQAALEALILVVELAGPTFMRALNRPVVRAFNTDRKETHWGRRKLKRDE